ncbi:TIGR02710 family CRISPR-associated CARF protein [Bacillus sp. HMF5848]|uniref:TIGR02710 family CRISPR-associated CARF protein n=1 Tax=Bacillus sp. HMF5848 TaxID=2495421 RepID=UPI001639B7DA|nr:TIGR02710 family CRISPR-associated CARF protein [Bacillus sp. HMF5848]
MGISSSKEKTELMICSVGGAPQPILYSLKTIQPENVIFYCSTSTVENVNEFIRECPFIVKHSVIETDNWEDIDENLHLLYKKLPEHIKRRNVEWKDIIVDYTGGTKTMGAALVLSTVDKGVKYAYVSGNERSKEGVGIVVDGTEKILLKTNPWNSIAYEQRKQISNIFNLGRYDEAIQLAKTIHNNLTDASHWKAIFKELAVIFEGYQDWDKFRHKQARESLRKGLSKLTPYRFVEDSIDSFLNKVEGNFEVLELNNSKKTFEKSTFILHDLIANAIRRGKQEQKYDDAVARLYRSIELIAQNQLLSKYEIYTGKCSAEQIPEAIREEYTKKYLDEESNLLRFGLHASYQLLYHLDDEVGKLYVSRKEEISKRLTIRNNSILAHGLIPVTEKGFTELLEITLSLCQIDENDLIRFPRIDL